MSATLLTYNSQRETRLKGQERATQCRRVAAVLWHGCDPGSEFKGGSNCGVPEIMLGELGLLCPDALSHTRREESGGDVLLVTEVKPGFICGDSRGDGETPTDGVLAAIPPVPTTLPTCL